MKKRHQWNVLKKALNWLLIALVFSMLFLAIFGDVSSRRIFYIWPLVVVYAVVFMLVKFLHRRF